MTTHRDGARRPGVIAANECDGLVRRLGAAFPFERPETELAIRKN
jgi:hypothetical protein